MQRHATYLSFLNTCGLPVRLVDIIAVDSHTAVSMTGWEGIVSLTGVGSNEHLYDIDIRLAWGTEIFQQHLVDYGWTEQLLLTKKHKNEPLRHKIIVYLCQPTTGLETNTTNEVPSHLIVGNYWSSVHHLYIAMPRDHPFDVSDLAKQADQLGGYATTRSLIQKHSEIEPSPSSLPVHPQRGGEGGLRTRGHTKQSQTNAPLVSVITVVFQGAHYLEQTIQSVINQTYSNIEYIIIDGGSTDGTLDIIKKYEGCIDYWVSEPDRGISHAFNKGIQVSSGDWIGIINCGDLYLPNALEIIFHKTDLTGYQFTFGDMVWDSNGQVSLRLGRKDYNDVIKYVMVFHHPTIFVRRTIYNSYGGFSEDYKYAMDYEFLLRIHNQGSQGKYIASIIARMIDQGAHKKNYLKALNESRKISISQGGGKAMSFLAMVYTYVNQNLFPFPVLKILRKLVSRQST